MESLEETVRGPELEYRGVSSQRGLQEAKAGGGFTVVSGLPEWSWRDF